MHRKTVDDAAGFDHPSIAPERLLRAILPQPFHSIRSERQLMKRQNLDLLFRWFVGLEIDDPVWDAATFSKNRTLVLTEGIAQGFLVALLSDRRVKRLSSTEHFSVDGTMLKAFRLNKKFSTEGRFGEDSRGWQA